MTQQIIITTILLFLFISCESRKTKEKTKHPDWVTLTLPNGWQLQTPKNFKDTTVQGIDSDPGYIYSKSDSIVLQFDSGVELLPKDDCDFSKQVDEAKKDIISGFYKDFYKVPTLHKAYIDTIDNKVATFVLPIQTGKGTVGISISDCKSGHWLGIRGQNLNGKREKLVLDILNTLELKNNEP
jgi:hypothetical protein